MRMGSASRISRWPNASVHDESGTPDRAARRPTDATPVGGAVILVDRAAPESSTRAALCAGLTEIEQRTAGRLTVTSGLVTTLG